MLGIRRQRSGGRREGVGVGEGVVLIERDAHSRCLLTRGFRSLQCKTKLRSGVKSRERGNHAI